MVPSGLDAEATVADAETDSDGEAEGEELSDAVGMLAPADFDAADFVPLLFEHPQTAEANSPTALAAEAVLQWFPITRAPRIRAVAPAAL
ncbi:hypothetical protein NRF20_37835 [Streptomyces sp. R-74717]|uniref:hypothetical protein n=1 Tax=Streptomyces TaxID=1883 RepID=UPI0037B0435F